MIGFDLLISLPSWLANKESSGQKGMIRLLVGEGRRKQGHEVMVPLVFILVTLC